METWEAVEKNTVLENPVDFKFKRDFEEFSVTFVRGRRQEIGSLPDYAREDRGRYEGVFGFERGSFIRGTS